MSDSCRRAVWTESKLSGNALLTLLALAEIADESGFCAPSLVWLMRRTKRTKASVQRTLKQCSDFGELAIFNGQGHATSNGKTNLYQILLPIEGVSQTIPLDSTTGLYNASGDTQTIPLEVSKMIPLVHENSELSRQGVSKMIPMRRRRHEEDREESKTENLPDLEQFKAHFLKLGHAFTSVTVQNAIQFALQKYGVDRTIEAYEIAIERGAEDIASYAAACLRNPKPVKNGTKPKKLNRNAKKALAPNMRFAYDFDREQYLDTETGDYLTEAEYRQMEF